MSVTYCGCVFVASGIQRGPYCHLWPARLHNIFPHCPINVTIFENRSWTQNVFWFSPEIFSKIFLTLRRSERDTIKNVYWCSTKVPVSSQILVKLEFSFHIFEKYSDIKLMKIRAMGDRWTDRGTAMTTLIVVFRNFANASKDVCCLARCSGQWRTS
jgi:hypothetical protein